MMSKTHLAVGMATALALSGPKNTKELLITVAAGAVGGVFADCDTVKNDSSDRDALKGELIAVGITVLMGAIDVYLKLGGVSEVLSHWGISLIGFIGVIILYIIGYRTEHRTFTHSILAKWLVSICFTVISVPFGIACFWGYTSHLVIDFLNKKGIQLLFPFKWRPCLKLCYASKTANKVFMIVGFIATFVLFVLYRIAL